MDGITVIMWHNRRGSRGDPGDGSQRGRWIRGGLTGLDLAPLTWGHHPDRRTLLGGRPLALPVHVHEFDQLTQITYQPLIGEEESLAAALAATGGQVSPEVTGWHLDGGHGIHGRAVAMALVHDPARRDVRARIPDPHPPGQAATHHGIPACYLAPIQQRSRHARTFTARLVPYEQEVELLPDLWEVFTRGAFRDAVREPGRVKLMAPEHHHATIGVATTVADKSDGVHAEFRMSSTPDAQDTWTLIVEGMIDEVSIDFQQLPAHRRIGARRGGGTLMRHDRARLLGASPVAHGAYGRHATVTSGMPGGVPSQAREQALAQLARLAA